MKAIEKWKPLRCTVAVCSLFILFSPACGYAETAFDTAVALHDKASEQPDAATVEQAKKLLEPLAEKSALAKAYLGSIITIEAAVAAENKNGIKALALLGKGSDLIDEAVSSEPDNADLRFLRMINGYGVSIDSPHNRFKVVRTDLDWLDSRKAQFSPRLQGTIALYKGLYLAKSRMLDEALEAFDTCIAVSPGSPEAAEAEKQLARYSE